MLVRCSWTHLSLSFYIALIWVESSQSRRKPAVFLSAFFFFCFFFLASSPVTCLTFHPINSRTTSRTAGAKVVPLEPQTDKPAGSWLRVRAGVTAWRRCCSPCVHVRVAVATACRLSASWASSGFKLSFEALNERFITRSALFGWIIILSNMKMK